MSDFIVSARKYRPSTFSSVIGQNALTATLKSSIKNNHLAHAYLFCGPRGVGKTTCARIFAKTINCLHLTADFEACNECESCKSFNEQRSYNVHELDAASNNSVDDIRELIKGVQILPQSGKYKVYIIDEVHMLSSQAFNAFLKTLEEPPAYAIFILATTEKHKVIPTILSRCQIYDFNRITMKDTVEYLQYVAGKEGITAESSALNAIAQKADGGMRDALSIFDQIVSSCGQNITYQGVVSNLNVLDYEFYFRLTEAILTNDIVNALLIFNDILSRGFDGNQFITGMSTHLRDLLVSKDAQTVQLLDVSTDIAEKYKTQAEKCPLEFLIQALKIANDCDLNYQLSRNKRLLVELTLIRLCQLTDEKKKTIIEDEPIAPLQKIVPANLPVNVPVTSPVSQSVVQPVTQQPAVSPQPQAATSPINQPAPPPAPAASSLRRPMGISIHSENAAANVADTSAPIAVPVAVPQQNEVFKEEPVTASDLEAAWVAFAATIPEEVRMVNFINENKPQLVSDNLFEVTVVNQLLMKELERLKPGLMSFLHARLNNITLQMSISITAEAATSRALSPEEHYRTWVEQNPALEKLRQGLNMEID